MLLAENQALACLLVLETSVIDCQSANSKVNTRVFTAIPHSSNTVFNIALNALRLNGDTVARSAASSVVVSRLNFVRLTSLMYVHEKPLSKTHHHVLHDYSCGGKSASASSE